MKYENRLPPEGINVGKTSVLGEVIALLLGFALLVALLVIVLYFAGGQLAGHVPFSWEKSLTRHIAASVSAEDARTATLQRLANQLAKGASLPEDMAFTIKYVDDREVNAYATLGGVIYMHRGLVERLHSENAIAMVLAHEMAHVIHRDPARAMGGRLLVSLTLNMIGAVIGTGSLNQLAGTTGSLALLSFSREDEHRADLLGLDLVGRHYGHIAGTEEVFRELAAYEAKLGVSIPEFLSDHPETASRNETLRQEAEKMGFPVDGTLTPVPASLRSDKE